MKVLSKITLKDLNSFKAGALKAKVAESEASVFVGRIVGSVRSQFVKATPYGESVGFKGTFVGYGVDGEESRAVVCYLPSPVDQMLSDQINELQGDKDRLENPVDFAVDVFATLDKGETGYKYICKPLLETKVADPIANLLAAVKPLALSAPVVAETPLIEEAETAKEAAKSAKSTKG